jgi:DNA-directed RNA polymerase specialized sigma24 family protein
METAYKDLRPVMFGALGKLARQGFVVAPADAVDLIHDFFVERWDNLVNNYDPQKGRFEVYSYVSFVHFARPRILRLQRLQNCLQPEDIEMLTANYDAERNLAAEQDTRIVRHAISRLAQGEREVLTNYIYAEAPSERMLAAKFKVSRYRLRETLIEALGRVLVLLDKPERMPERDWRVALALWRDRRTITEAASYLGMTTHQIRGANSRNMRLIAEALRSYEPHKGPHLARRSTMKAKEAKTGRQTPQVLLEKALRSEGNQDLLRQVSARAQEVLAVLEKPESFGLSENEIGQMDPLWIAEVYEALSRASSEWEAAVAHAPEDLFYAHAGEERQIGTAFKEALIADLPDDLRDPHQWLGPTVPKVEEDEREYALKTPSAEGAMLKLSPQERVTSEAASLADYGVTPLMVLRSTQAISFLLDRFLRKGKLDLSVPVTLPCETIRTGDSFDPEILVDEIRRVAECRQITADALYRWDIRVARYKPHLFERFHAEPNEEGILLTRTENRYDDLFKRWRFSEMAVPVPA